jgi:hypothetical protein
LLISLHWIHKSILYTLCTGKFLTKIMSNSNGWLVLTLTDTSKHCGFIWAVFYYIVCKEKC